MGLALLRTLYVRRLPAPADSLSSAKNSVKTVIQAIIIGQRGRLTWIPTLNVPKSTQTRPRPRAYILVLVVALEDGFALRVRDLRIHHLDIVRRCARGGILRGHDELMG
jgi:hypothetical protein